ncbi:hypothetical protein CY34DRAFT_809789 [Suillus luteus UH-Slu-Lm8-n1]|uniref:Uncharacterized protein n=1 Tax=Suillus luteus UH-Slu-Lm8-n1 TaxID=930992 RepID=A0A0D0A8M8_9AGAM|nr:hypothetical protein CY34DRAFT_809789 [Suillus luteus UH-Slu-Lm8-n1]
MPWARSNFQEDNPTCSSVSSWFLSSCSSFRKSVSRHRLIRLSVVKARLVAALQKESSELGNVNDEECQSYSDPCPSGYLASCCYTVPNVVSAMIQFQRGRSDLTIVLLLLQPV